MRVKGKVAFVSGGARGLGAAQATLLAREGASVVIGDLREDEGKALAAAISAAGGEAAFVGLDVTDAESWHGAVETAERRFGKVDVLVNNAGVYERRNIDETSLNDWDRVMDINSKGVFLGTRTIVPVMKRAGGGSIVNMSSIAGLVGSRISAAYNASKGAVRLLTKTTALQHAKDGIRANSLHPGPSETDMLSQVYPDAEYMKSRLAEVPLGRFGRVEDVAYGVLFLASDESSYVTGAELVIDGGVTAQ